MAKLPVKAKQKPKTEEMYTVVVPLIPDCSIDERESIIRRAIFREQAHYESKPFRFIITEKTMEQAKINFFVRKIVRTKK